MGYGQKISGHDRGRNTETTTGQGIAETGTANGRENRTQNAGKEKRLDRPAWTGDNGNVIAVYCNESSFRLQFKSLGKEKRESRKAGKRLSTRFTIPICLHAMPRILSISAVLFILTTIVSSLHAEPPKSVPPIRIVYFVPSDREPIPDRQERLGRVMRHVREFYRTEMNRNGYGPMTFSLEWEEPGKLKLHTVHGKKKQAEYGRGDSAIIREEVREALRSQYIDLHEEVVVIFQLLLRWDGDKAVELGPFVGGGSHLSGIAWVYDDPLLDADLLTSKEPGGYYQRPCSLGQFNTHYIGGLAHEMGHAFSLPHACESKRERKERNARALMGSGNHTFGRDLRGEGEGTFLSPSSALRLSRVRAFAGNLPGIRERHYLILDELHAEPVSDATNGDPRFVLTGRVTGFPRPIGMIAYNDNRNIPADYDAVTWTVPLDAEGRFRFEISELIPVPYQLRLVGVHSNGATSRFLYNYEVTPDGIDLAAFNDAVPLERMKKLFNVGNAEELQRLAERFRDRENIRNRVDHLRGILRIRSTNDLATLSDSIAESPLHLADYSEANIGWGAPCRGHVPEEIFIEVGGEFFASGLFAHAPSSYKFDLGRRWKTLHVGYGLQDGHDGPVRFVVLGDGNELFRSDVIRDHQAREETISIDGIGILQLRVDSAASRGNSGAWAVWLNPIVKR